MAAILIIEDNQANLELMSYLLTAFGHTTMAANDGVVGVALAQNAHPHIIICDIQLPLIDGYEIARRLKADPTTARIPIVAVTALAMVGDREHILQAGFDGYISKPIDPEQFISQIDMFLPLADRSVLPQRVCEAEPTSDRSLYQQQLVHP